VHTVEVAVVGAGVVGLAIARTLAREGREVLVLEAARSFGTGASSRNSEVIHAGIYYPPGSLKARLCVAGREQLYEYCARFGIAHRRCGKLIVADSPSQTADLERIASVARSNGVELAALGREQARHLEPALQCHAALYSEHTGIIDTHAYMLALAGEAEAHGATCAYESRVTRMWLQDRGVVIAVNGDGPTLLASIVVNAAGSEAPELARSIEGFPSERVPRSYLSKGSYFALAGRSPFRRLIYPVPEPGGLGVHLTLDLAGRARFGPDVQWVDRQDYDVDPGRAAHFYSAIRRYWPGLADGALQPAYAGIRPKIAGPGEPAADFRIDGPEAHSAPVVNLFGIESPGFTASLAIGEQVAEILRPI
jgi:L-2-hydroxyglutarate oxidase LhgO